MRRALCPFVLVLTASGAVGGDRVVAWTGMANAWLDGPGGPIEFKVEVGPEPGSFRIWNAGERIEVPIVKDDGKTLTLRFDDYDSTVTATAIDDSGRELKGEWVRGRGPKGSANEFVRLPFHLNARGYCPSEVNRVEAAETKRQLIGQPRWRATFADDPDPAVLVFSISPNAGGRPDDIEHATFLTTTGDYRYLTPSVGAGTITMSCFDGSHAFLFAAKVAPDGSLRGDFWSGQSGHTTWTAVPDAKAALPDGFGIARVNAAADVNTLSYPDPSGKLHSLGGPEFAGGCRIIEVFGTWCPNCRDATVLLKEYHTKYAGRGLRVVGLAFEVTGDKARDLAQVGVYATRHAVPYPLLLAGTNDKAKNREAFPVLEKIAGYPTLLFIDRAGKVRSAYTGFSGPATGEEHEKMKARFEKIIEGMLGE